MLKKSLMSLPAWKTMSDKGKRNCNCVHGKYQMITQVKVVFSRNASIIWALLTDWSPFLSQDNKPEKGSNTIKIIFVFFKGVLELPAYNSAYLLHHIMSLTVLTTAQKIWLHWYRRLFKKWWPSKCQRYAQYFYSIFVTVRELLLPSMPRLDTWNLSEGAGNLKLLICCGPVKTNLESCLIISRVS